MEDNSQKPPPLPSLPPPDPPPPPPLPHSSPAEQVQPTSSSQRKSIVLKKRPKLDPDNRSEKRVETTKSYAEMATKAITPAEDSNAFLDSSSYDQAFPSLSADAGAKIASWNRAGSTKPPISTQARELYKENLAPATPNNSSKAQGQKAPIFHERSSSYGGSKEILDQYIPEEIVRRVSTSGRGQQHFGRARRGSFSSPKGSKRKNSGYYNPTRSYLEGYSTKPDEDREGNPLHNLATHSTDPTECRGFPPRRSSYSGRGRGRPPTSPGGTPLREISWRHEQSCNQKNDTAQNDGDHIGETRSPAEHSPGSPWGESPTRATTGPSDITRPIFGDFTDDTNPGLERGLEEAMESPTPPPNGRASHDIECGHQEEIEQSSLTPGPEIPRVAKDHVSLSSSGSRTTGFPADGTSGSEPHDARNNAQQTILQSSASPPPGFDTQTSTARLSDLHSLSSTPSKLLLPTMSGSYEERMDAARKKNYSQQGDNPPEKMPRPRLSASEYLGLPPAPWHIPGTPAHTIFTASTKTEGNAMSDNKTASNDKDKVADLDEGYEAIGPSKIVQYAPTVQDKASKAFAGQEKVNFGDMDPRKAAPAPVQVVSGKAPFNSPAGFTDQHSSFASQSSDVRLPARPVQPPPGLPLPPGLPIPASYYQQQGIALQTGPGNISLSQPRERSTPFTQAIDNPQAAPGQYLPAYPNMGPLTVGQRSGVNDSYLDLSVTDAEIKVINETFSKYGQIRKEETPSFTDRYGRRGAVSEQGGTSKGGNSKTTEKDSFKERFEEVFGKKGKVSIEVLQEHQKKRLVAERVRNEKLAAEDKKKVPEPVTGNTGLFPYPAHGKSDGEVTQELLVEVFKHLSTYVEDKSVRDLASGEKGEPSDYQPGPWKKPPAGKIRPPWISDDNTSFFDQSFGKDFVPEGRAKTTDEGNEAVKLRQTAAKGDANSAGGSGNQSVRMDLTSQDKQSVDEVQASNTPGNVIFGPPKPPGYPNHLPPREHLRPLKTFAPFENDHRTVRYGLLPANPRSVNTAEKSYINYRGGAVGPVADSAPRYVYGPKGYLELAKDTPPPPPADPSPFGQSKATASPFAALEQALGTTRFTQGAPQHSHLAAPKPPPGAKPTGGLVTDTINGFLRVNYGGRQTQLDPDGSGLSRSEVLKRKQRPGARIGVNFDGPNGMEFDIDKTDFNPADHNVLGGKFKLKSQLRKEQEALRAQLSQQSQQSQAGGAHQASPAKGTPVQGKGSDAGSGTRSVFNMPPGGNQQPSPSTPRNWAAQGTPESRRGMKGGNGGMGGR